MSRATLLSAALAGTLVLVAVVASHPDEPPTIVEARPGRDVVTAIDSPGTANPATQPPPSAARRVDWPAVAPRADSAWDTAPPPPPAEAVAPSVAPAVASVAPAPVAPPFPYRWVGDLIDDRGHQALLDGPQRALGARVGDVLDDTWRVDAIDERRLTITWLPGPQAVVVTGGRP